MLSLLTFFLSGPCGGQVYPPSGGQNFETMIFTYALGGRKRKVGDKSAGGGEIHTSVTHGVVRPLPLDTREGRLYYP